MGSSEKRVRKSAKSTPARTMPILHSRPVAVCEGCGNKIDNLYPPYFWENKHCRISDVMFGGRIHYSLEKQLFRVEESRILPPHVVFFPFYFFPSFFQR